MTKIKHKTNPGVLNIIFHVILKNITAVLFNGCKFIADNLKKLSFGTLTIAWKIIKHSVLLPYKLLVAGGRVLLKRLNFIKWIGVALKFSGSWSIKKTIIFFKCIWKSISNTVWWLLHQFSLTSIDHIRSLETKPMFSFGWALRGEFSPRHKLEYWMGDSHVIVEVRWWSYNEKHNKLRYIESVTNRQVSVHSPHGIGHMVSTLRWWDPVVQSSVSPYAPLHSIIKSV